METSESPQADRRLSIALRVRMSAHDAHYGGNLVDGARILGLFGDAATALLIMHDGDEGLFRAYSSVDFLAPTYAGDYLEITAQLMKIGTTSRTIEFTASKFIEAQPAVRASAASYLPEPRIVCRAVGVCVVPKPSA